MFRLLQNSLSFVLFFSLLSLFEAKAQNTALDSIYVELSNSVEDTARIKVHYKLAFQYARINLDSAKYHGETSLTLAKNIDYSQGMAGAYEVLAYIFYHTGKRDTALSYFQKGLEIRKANDNKERSIALLNNIGAILNSLNRREEAFEHFLEALKEAEEMGNVKILAAANQNIGNLYRKSGDYLKALEHHKKSQPYFEEDRDSVGLGMLMRNIAMDYEALGNLDESIKYLYKGLKFYEEVGDVLGQANVYHSLGILYNTIKKPEEAIEFFSKSIDLNVSLGAENRMNALANLYNDIGNSYEVKDEYEKALSYFQKCIDTYKNELKSGPAYANIGRLYKAQKDYTLSLEYLKKGLKIFEETDNKRNQVIAHLEIANSYYYLKAFQPALRSFNRALEIGEEIQAQEELIDVYQGLGQVYNKLGNKERAFDFTEKYAQIKDTIYNKTLADEVSRQEKKYELEKKEKEVLQSKLLAEKAESHLMVEQKNNERKLIIAGALLLISIFIGIAIFNKQGQKNAEAENKALRARVNPHFFFNSLNSMRYLSLTSAESCNACQRVGESLTQSAQMFRNVLENSKNALISIRKEMEIIYALIEIQKLRKVFHCHVYIGENVDQDALYIPPMVLVKLVENSIEHGIMKFPAETDKDLQVDISIELKGEKLICKVEDNGVGYQKQLKTQARVKMGEAYGLEYVRESIKKNKGDFSIMNLNPEQGSRATLTFFL